LTIGSATPFDGISWVWANGKNGQCPLFIWATPWTTEKTTHFSTPQKFKMIILGYPLFAHVHHFSPWISAAFFP